MFFPLYIAADDTTHERNFCLVVEVNPRKRIIEIVLALFRQAFLIGGETSARYKLVSLQFDRNAVFADGHFDGIVAGFVGLNSNTFLCHRHSIHFQHSACHRVITVFVIDIAADFECRNIGEIHIIVGRTLLVEKQRFVGWTEFVHTQHRFYDDTGSFARVGDGVNQVIAVIIGNRLVVAGGYVNGCTHGWYSTGSIVVKCAVVFIENTVAPRHVEYLIAEGFIKTVI